MGGGAAARCLTPAAAARSPGAEGAPPERDCSAGGRGAGGLRREGRGAAECQEGGAGRGVRGRAVPGGERSDRKSWQRRGPARLPAVGLTGFAAEMNPGANAAVRIWACEQREENSS